MSELILAERSDGRIIAGLVTSLVFNWNRLPVAVQTAIICHASETGFGGSDVTPQADERIVDFIHKHHRIIRANVRPASWAPQRLWTIWQRKRRLVRVMSRPALESLGENLRDLWAERRARQERDPRRTVVSEFSRFSAGVRRHVDRLRRAS